MCDNVHGYDKPYFRGYQAFVYGNDELDYFCSRENETLDLFIARVVETLQLLGGHAEVLRCKYDVDGCLIDLVPVWKSLSPIRSTQRVVLKNDYDDPMFHSGLTLDVLCCVENNASGPFECEVKKV